MPESPSNQVAETEPALLGQARAVHHHLQRLRNYVLKGQDNARIVPAGDKEPTWTQLRAMMVLATLGPCTLKEFAKEMDVAPASASEMIDRLHESGWVSREQNASDRRRIVIELTKEARDQSTIHERFVLGQLLRLMERMDKEHLQKWADVIAHINEIIRQEQAK